MNRCVEPLSLLCLLVSAGYCLGQEKPTAYERLKFLEPTIGTWVRKSTASFDLPDLGVKEGDPVVWCNSNEWCVDKSAILHKEWLEKDDGTHAFDWAMSMTTWDPETKRVVAIRVNRDGARHEQVFEKTPGGFSVTVKRTALDGRRASHTIVQTVNGDKMTGQMINIIRDGEKSDDLPVRESTRRAKN